MHQIDRNLSSLVILITTGAFKIAREGRSIQLCSDSDLETGDS